MTKYDEQFKLSVVQSYEASGQGFKSVAQRYGLHHTTVQHWVAAYRQHGVSGLRKKLSHYSAEFKLSVLLRMQQEDLSATQALALFNIRKRSNYPIIHRRPGSWLNPGHGYSTA